MHFMSETPNPPGVGPTPVFLKLAELLDTRQARYRVIEHPAAGKSEEVARIRGTLATDDYLRIAQPRLADIRQQ
ncbi:hypothetical protein [Massilia suwonensis]|uniref:Uncharacterized protein n=1 Tax=Massilia suwonensis TaxID=648895 RepID=A0ABW0MN34_9BURK